MSAYNSSAYLREAIESILNQSYKNFELIVVNDGSTDSTESIIRSYTDSRIVYIKNDQNLGLIASLNNGISLAKGEYIARMDADDISVYNRLELQLKCFEENPNSIIVGTDYYLLNEKGLLKQVKNVDNSDYQKAMLLFAPCFCHPTVMIKNIFASRQLSYSSEFVYAEDYKLWTDLAFIGEFHNVNIPLLKYRSHNSQVSVKNHAAQLRISERIRIEYYKQLNFNFSDDQINTLFIIGNNTFITSENILLNIEICLKELSSQNERLNIFNNQSFNLFLQKFWMDSCGNTNLGLKAYFVYTNSTLSALTNVSRKQKLFLFGKCLIRKFRNN